MAVQQTDETMVAFLLPGAAGATRAAADTGKVSQGVATGFAVAGYELALRGIKALLAAKK